MIATHPHFVAYCTQAATGTSTSHKRVNPQVMMQYLLPYQAGLAEKFDHLAAQLLAKKIANFKDAREFTELRDWLLPLLMNGQVRVR